MEASRSPASSLMRMLSATLGVVMLVALIYSLPLGQASEDERVHVMVSILPQAEFAEAVGGGHVSITVMVPPGQEPHTYAPKPSQMVQLEQADVYYKIGAGLEFELTWMDRFMELNQDMLVVDASESIDLIATGDSVTGASDPHIWLSPMNVVVMVQNLRDGLKAVDPFNASDYDDNAQAYIERLLWLDANITLSLAPLQNRNLLTFHPAWGYFAEEYGLDQRSIESEGKEPSAMDVASLIDFAKENGIRVIFAEPQFSTRTAEQIADEIDGAVVLVDDLAKDYIQNLQEVADEIVEGLT